MTRVFDEDTEPEPPDPQPAGHLKPVGPALVIALLVIGALLGWAVVLLLPLVDEPLPTTPWTLCALLFLLATLAWLGSRRMLAARRHRETRPASEVGVVLLSLGRAMLATGLLMAGGQVAVALSQMRRLQVPLYRERFQWALIGGVSCIAFAVGGWFLERACRIRPGDW